MRVVLEVSRKTVEIESDSFLDEDTRGLLDAVRRALIAMDISEEEIKKAFEV